MFSVGEMLSRKEKGEFCRFVYSCNLVFLCDLKCVTCSGALLCSNEQLKVVPYDFLRFYCTFRSVKIALDFYGVTSAGL